VKAAEAKAGPSVSMVKVSDEHALEIENRDCVRCMHCINVITGGLAPGVDKGATILVGGKRTLKIGDLMGTVVVPFMKLATDEDREKLVDLAKRIVDFFAENIGLVNFLEGVELEIDANMVATPRTNPYVRMDGWDEEVARINAKKSAAA